MVTFAFAFIVSPPEPPLLDANRQPLAETQAEGYCSGIYLMTQAPVAQCWNENVHRGAVRSLGNVQFSFCTGIIDGGWDRTHFECKEIMADQLYWPLLAGGITNSWNARYAYPLDRFTDNIKPDESRTGIREGEER